MITLFKLSPFIFSPLIVYFYELNNVNIDWLDIPYNNLYFGALIVSFYSLLFFVIFINFEIQIQRKYRSEIILDPRLKFLLFVLLFKIIDKLFLNLSLNLRESSIVPSSSVYDLVAIMALIFFANIDVFKKSSQTILVFGYLIFIPFYVYSGSKGSILGLFIVYFLFQRKKVEFILFVLFLFFLVIVFIDFSFIDRFLNPGISSAYYYSISENSQESYISYFLSLIQMKINTIAGDQFYEIFIPIKEYLNQTGYASGYNITPSIFFIDDALNLLLVIFFLLAIFIIMNLQEIKKFFTPIKIEPIIYFIGLSVSSSTIFDAYKYLIIAFFALMIYKLLFLFLPRRL